MKQTLYRIVQCTWGLPQTLAGFLVFLRFRGYSYRNFHGAVHTRWPKKNGVSLGMFIFTPDSGDDWGGNMVFHEYGHTFQSLMLGPLYLIAIGIPSAVWCGCFAGYRRKHGVPYSAFPVEKWADDLGGRWREKDAAKGGNA